MKTTKRKPKIGEGYSHAGCYGKLWSAAITLNHLAATRRADLDRAQHDAIALALGLIDAYRLKVLELMADEALAAPGGKGAMP